MGSLPVNAELIVTKTHRDNYRYEGIFFDRHQTEFDMILERTGYLRVTLLLERGNLRQLRYLR